MQPKIYHVEEHKIAPERIDEHASYVIRKLKEAGHTAYLVGGGVRDLLLAQVPKDFDVSTSAKPEEIKRLFRNSILIGRRFRLAHVRFGNKIIEVSTFRSGFEAAGLIVRDNEWGTEEQDVLRRDFTINGLFYDPETQTIIDYVEGYCDIGKKVLRAIGQPDVRFIQDPVRMIRLIKFCARFDFTIHPPTFEALLDCKNEIIKSSSVRIFEELLRMLESGAARSFFHLLHEYGLLHPLAPALSLHLEETENNATLQLLGAIDSEVRKQSMPHRALGMAALLFPLFEKRVLSQSTTEGKFPHLGEITNLAYDTIDHVFSPFFTIPRQMRFTLSFLLTQQYRFAPLDGKVPRTLRVPNEPFVPLALHFLKIRSTIQSDLLSFYHLWTEKTFLTHQKQLVEIAPRKKRRRRRR